MSTDTTVAVSTSAEVMSTATSKVALKVTAPKMMAPKVVPATTTTESVSVPARDDIRVAMMGNVDSGKSTLVGCLTKNIVDDGRGLARSKVFRHRHEGETGRTSSVGVEVMGFSGEKQVVADSKAARNRVFQHIRLHADRSITLIDLCGHEKYLKTTVFGLTGYVPDYGIIVVGANMGVSRMTREHLGIASHLNLPLMIVVTKVDIAPVDVYKKTMTQVSKALRLAKKKPYLVKGPEDVPRAVSSLVGGHITPVIVLSNVAGEALAGLETLKHVLSKLPGRRPSTAVTAEVPEVKSAEAPPAPVRTDDTSKDADASKDASADKTPKVMGGGGGGGAGTDADDAVGTAPLASEPTILVPDKPGRVIIDSVFTVPGVGTVVAGTVMAGCVRAGETMMLGPDRAGHFNPVLVRSIHVQYTPTEIATSGGSAAFAIRLKGKAKGGSDKKRSWVKKGMALVHPTLNPSSSWEFDAEILVLHHQTTLSVGYAPIIHCGVVTQSARILSISSVKGGKLDALRTGDRAVIRCKFMYRPEYLEVGSMLLFREGRAKGVGRIKAVVGRSDAMDKK